MSPDRFIARKLKFQGKLAAASIAVSFLVIIVAVAVSSGFRQSVRDGVARLTGDIRIAPSSAVAAEGDADYDTITATVQGFNIGVKVHERVPYSRIELVDYGAPFAFHIELHFDPAPANPYQTEFWVKLEADLNLMMKMMLSGKIKEALDNTVEGTEYILRRDGQLSR